MKKKAEKEDQHNEIRNEVALLSYFPDRLSATLLCGATANGRCFKIPGRGQRVGVSDIS